MVCLQQNKFNFKASFMRFFLFRNNFENESTWLRSPFIQISILYTYVGDILYSILVADTLYFILVVDMLYFIRAVDTVSFEQYNHWPQSQIAGSQGRARLHLHIEPFRLQDARLAVVGGGGISTHETKSFISFSLKQRHELIITCMHKPQFLVKRKWIAVDNSCTCEECRLVVFQKNLSVKTVVWYFYLIRYLFCVTHVYYRFLSFKNP